MEEITIMPETAVRTVLVSFLMVHVLIVLLRRKPVAEAASLLLPAPNLLLLLPLHLRLIILPLLLPNLLLTILMERL